MKIEVEIPDEKAIDLLKSCKGKDKNFNIQVEIPMENMVRAVKEEALSKEVKRHASAFGDYFEKYLMKQEWKTL